jgi:hypothetical protein
VAKSKPPAPGSPDPNQPVNVPVQMTGAETLVANFDAMSKRVEAERQKYASKPIEVIIKESGFDAVMERFKTLTEGFVSTSKALAAGLKIGVKGPTVAELTGVVNEVAAYTSTEAVKKTVGIDIGVKTAGLTKLQTHLENIATSAKTANDNVSRLAESVLKMQSATSSPLGITLGATGGTTPTKKELAANPLVQTTRRQIDKPENKSGKGFTTDLAVRSLITNTQPIPVKVIGTVAIDGIKGLPAPIDLPTARVKKSESAILKKATDAVAVKVLNTANVNVLNFPAVTSVNVVKAIPLTLSNLPTGTAGKKDVLNTRDVNLPTSRLQTGVRGGQQVFTRVVNTRLIGLDTQRSQNPNTGRTVNTLKTFVVNWPQVLKVSVVNNSSIPVKVVGAVKMLGGGGGGGGGGPPTVVKDTQRLAIVGLLLGAATSLKGLATAGFQGTVQGYALSNQFTQLSKQLAGVVLPVVDALTRALMRVNAWFMKLSERDQDRLLVGGGVAAGAAVGLPIAAKLIGLIGSAGTALAGLGTSLAGVVAWVGRVVKMFGGFGALLGRLGSAAGSLANPIVGLAIGLGVLLVSSEQVRRAVGDVFRSLGRLAVDIFDIVKMPFQALARAYQDSALELLFMGLGQVFSDLGETLAEIVAVGFTMFSDALDAMGDGFVFVADVVGAVLENLFTAINKLLKLDFSGAKNALSRPIFADAFANNEKRVREREEARQKRLAGGGGKDDGGPGRRVTPVDPGVESAEAMFRRIQDAVTKVGTTTIEEKQLAALEKIANLQQQQLDKNGKPVEQPKPVVNGRPR